MTREALIVGAAAVPGAEEFYARILRDADIVIACDAAGEWCLSLGRRPDLVVGDFDSACPGARERLEARGIPVRAYPVEKDASDLDIALTHARDMGAARVCFTGAFSGRLDHTLAALGTLQLAEDMAPRILEPGFRAWLLSGRTRPSIEFSVDSEATISVLALEASHGVTVTGMKYPLRGASVGVLSSLGISNTATGPVAGVSLITGTLLVIVSSDG
ncbi:MAG: thiamine diphosphokinase [Coriobacteriia bacterium]